LIYSKLLNFEVKKFKKALLQGTAYTAAVDRFSCKNGMLENEKRFVFNCRCAYFAEDLEKSCS